MRFSVYVRLNWLTTLLTLNVLLFVVPQLLSLLLGGTVQDTYGLVLYLLGALRADLVLAGGEMWRLLTSIFLHADVLHLLVNMIALYQLGVVVYAYYGGRKLITFYILSGLGGSLLGLIFLGPVPTVGASGAVFGLLGVLLAGSTKQTRYGISLPFQPWNILPLAIYSLLIGFIPGSGINNYAHLGGLITGMILGRLFHNVMTTYTPRWELRLADVLYWLCLVLFIGAYIWMSVWLIATLTA